MRILLLTLVALLVAAAPASAAGTRITVSNSEFGPMVWGPKRQAIYVFQRDAFKRSRCTGECAEAWPPVYTSGKPVAGKGARRSLLGTIVPSASDSTPPGKPATSDIPSATQKPRTVRMTRRTRGSRDAISATNTATPSPIATKPKFITPCSGEHISRPECTDPQTVVPRSLMKLWP